MKEHIHIDIYICIAFLSLAVVLLALSGCASVKERSDIEVMGNAYGYNQGRS